MTSRIGIIDNDIFIIKANIIKDGVYAIYTYAIICIEIIRYIFDYDTENIGEIINNGIYAICIKQNKPALAKN